MKRRDILKGLTLLPLTGTGVLPLSASASTHENGEQGPLVPGPQLFQSIGVEPLINCMGTYTIIGGSLERKSVREAMEAASRNFVQYDELAYAIGQRLAAITSAEWGMVSAGCAAGLKHVTAACVTGGDPEKLIRIPDLTGFEKTEVVIPVTSRNEYDHSIRNIGVKIINVATLDEMEKALSPRTALVYVKADDNKIFNVTAVAKITRAKNVPLLVDAAAQDLTIPSIHLQNGANIVAYSGGKALCGPQCSGILLGQKDILQSAWQASSPHHGPGRDNKVGREEMIGALAAVEAWATFDHEGQWKKWLSYLDTIAKKLSSVESLKTSIENPRDKFNNSPMLLVTWDPSKLNITGEELAEVVGRNKPRIALAFGTPDERDLQDRTAIFITAGQMQPSEDKVVAERLYQVLTAKREAKSTELKAPAANISGRWDVEVKYYSSSKKYTWVLQQDGNWINGVQSGEFTTQNIGGTIEASAVRVRTAYAVPGNHLTLTFTGTLSDDELKGSVYMVEYGTATFVARKYAYKENRAPLTVPGGPPLAT
jgi:seryl-tRNA(Sec) selenium transferase